MHADNLKYWFKKIFNCPVNNQRSTVKSHFLSKLKAYGKLKTLADMDNQKLQPDSLWDNPFYHLNLETALYVHFLIILSVENLNQLVSLSSILRPIQKAVLVLNTQHNEVYLH